MRLEELALRRARMSVAALQEHVRRGSTPRRTGRRSHSSTRTSRADVAVIGGGIVGITTALLLVEAGATVVAAGGRPPRRTA